jgi:peptidoglycan/xylan/chitin deacetylase (PgdA/CDA1 family)
LWTVDTRDWQRPGVAAIVNTVLTQAHDGSVILLHDGGGDRSQTVQALSQIISGLEQRGFAFTTL